MKKKLLLILFNCLLLAAFAQQRKDTVSDSERILFVQMHKKAHRKFLANDSHVLDSFLCSKNRAAIIRYENSSFITVYYDNATYDTLEDGSVQRRRYLSSHGSDAFPSFAYDTAKQMIVQHSFGYGNSYHHEAYFKDTNLVYEIEDKLYQPERYISIYDKDKALYLPTDTSRFAFIPHPLKEGKFIAISNSMHSSMKIKSFKILAHTGTGRLKRYLLEAVTDSLNKFYPYRFSFFISAYKKQLSILQKYPNNTFVEIQRASLGSSLAYFCGLEIYYTINEIYPLNIEMHQIDTVYSTNRQIFKTYSFYTPTLFTELASAGYASKRSVKKLIKNNKLACNSYENKYGYSSPKNKDEQIKKEYHETFRDKFILYLNKEKLGLSKPK